MRLGAAVHNSLAPNAVDVPAVLCRWDLSSALLGCRSEWTAIDRQQIRAAFAAAAVQIGELGAYCSLVHPDPETLAGNIARVVAALEAADDLGCLAVGTVGGGCHPGPYFLAAHHGNLKPETWARLIASVREILRRTEGLRACLCLEPWLTTNLGTPEALRRVLDEVASPRLKLILDAVNLVGLHNYFDTTSLLSRLFDLVGADTLVIHTKDTSIHPTKMTLAIEEVRAGAGNLDYHTLLRRAAQLPSETPLLIEHLRDEADVLAARDHIRDVAREIGEVLL